MFEALADTQILGVSQRFEELMHLSRFVQPQVDMLAENWTERS